MDLPSERLNLLGGARPPPHASVDELSARRLQRALHLVHRTRGNLGEPVRRFQAADRDYGNPGTPSQLLLFEAEQGTGGTNLFRRDQHDSYISRTPPPRNQAAIGTTCPPGTCSR